MAKKVKTKTTAAPKASKKAQRASATSASRAKKSVKTVTAKAAKKKTTKVNKNGAGNAKKAKSVTASKSTKAKSAPMSSRSVGSNSKKSPPRGTPLKKTGKNNRVPTATEQDPIQFVEEIRRIPKTYLTAKELREFKALLLQKRAELCADVTNLTKEALNKTDSGPSERSSMPIHMADLGSDNWEQEFTLGLIANEQAVLREIDAALERIENKTYGICLATHNQISKARLRAKLWAKYCIEYAQAREEGRAI